MRSSAEQGRLYADVNTSATVTLLDEARRHDVTTFVLGSTSSVYGETLRIPFVEADTADRPLAPYPASKRAAELFGHSYFHLYGLPVTALRFFNVYGPHGRPDMMPMRTIEAILSGETITLFDGGTLQRDWTYVDDIVDGVAAALERPMGYEVINLGFGAPIALNAFIHIYERLIGKQALTRTVEAPLHVGRTIAAASRPHDAPPVVLIDCLTLLANNVLGALADVEDADAAEAALRGEVDDLLAAYADHPGAWIIVSNEVGLGIVPAYPLGRVYRDVLGRANQRLAAAADAVYFMVAGLPLQVK